MLFSLLWLVLTSADPASWPVGLATVVAATALSLVLAPRPPRPIPWRVPGFAVYFLRESLMGGVDVVRRALAPAMPLDPDFVTVDVSRLDESQRLAFVFLVSLLPGTLSARLEGQRLHVHVLDGRLPVQPALAELQARIRAVIPSPATGTDGR